MTQNHVDKTDQWDNEAIDRKRRMEKAVRDGNVYLQTIDRLEPDIHMIDTGAGWASAAISLKRIADELNVANRLEALRQHSDAIVDAEKQVQWLRDHGLEYLIDSLPVDKLDAAVLQAKGMPQSQSGAPEDELQKDDPLLPQVSDGTN